MKKHSRIKGEKRSIVKSSLEGRRGWQAVHEDNPATLFFSQSAVGNNIRPALARFPGKIPQLRRTQSWANKAFPFVMLVSSHSPVGLLAALLLGMTLPRLAAAEEKIRFNEQIRPIFTTCFYCHGPDEKHREADLRLDIRENALADLGGYAAIVPGHPEKSELIQRISSHDKDEVMPPPKAKKPRLTDEQITLIKSWIGQGAEYEAHWSFLPLRAAVIPAVADRAWPKNAIDFFILAKLEGAGVRPSPEADRATLIRRVSLDLTGLLPSPEDVHAFIVDQRPDAYERLVDTLLASPHYGERWGRHWLDQARYADSNGYSIDSARAMWPYRDWVIKALNDDVPFDTFTIEQLAGDLLPNATKEQRIATAFHRNTLINEEGGTKPEQFRVEAAVDRVNTTAAVWLGLTVGCAQCHTHKFDPITQREFYQMLAFFNQGEDVNNRGATVEVARGEIFGTAPSAEEQRKQLETELTNAQPAWEKQELARLAATQRREVRWSPAKYVEYDTATGAGFQLLDDNSLLADGRGAFNDTYRVVAKSALKKVGAVRLRVLTHESLPHSGPGMATNGNFVLTGFDASLAGAEVRMARAFADHEQAGYPATAAIDDEAKTGWAINTGKDSKGKMNANHEIVFVFAEPLSIGDASIEVRLHHDLNQNYLVGRFALDFAESAPSAPAAQEDAYAVALRTPSAQRSREQQRLVRASFERTNPIGRESKAKGTEANSDIVELMVMKDVEKPRPTFIHLRGDFLRPDEKTGPLQPGVIAAVQSAFHNRPGEFRNRLDLARWLVSPENPLTPRVTMNRMWMRYFGRGFVETDEDFGTQGAAPTHPAALDWLAREFIRQRWSMKAMHRLIVTSATYRQSSKARPDLAEKDPRNLLLARQERVRVEAEIARDAALCASGQLNRAIGGPSVFPPQPEGVYAFTQNTKKWSVSTGAEHFRRALYTMFFRSAPYPLFTTFDAPDFQTVCTRRLRSNTPLQSLTLANDPAFFEIAQGLAARVIGEIPESEELNVDARLTRAFLLCLSRPPGETERTILRKYYDEQLRAFAGDPSATKMLLSEALAASATKPEITAAMVCVARAILNTDAFITRE